MIESHSGTLNRPNSKKTSVIDLTFSIGFRSLDWQHWSYLPSTGSDHEATSLRAFLPVYQPARSLPLQQALEEAANESISVKRPGDRSKAWWGPGLTSLRARYHRAFRRYKRSSTREMKTACLQAVNNYFQAVDRAKTDYCFTFLAEARGQEIFTVYKYTKPRFDPFVPSMRCEVNGKEGIAYSFFGKMRDSGLHPFHETASNRVTLRHDHRRLYRQPVPRSGRDSASRANGSGPS